MTYWGSPEGIFAVVVVHLKKFIMDYDFFSHSRYSLLYPILYESFYILSLKKMNKLQTKFPPWMNKLQTLISSWVIPSLYLTMRNLCLLMFASLYLVLGAKVGKSRGICLIYSECFFALKRWGMSWRWLWKSLFLLDNIICLLKIP